MHLFICALWSPTGKGLTSWLSFVVSNCEFVTFPLVSVWYLIVSIPDLCTLTYFVNKCQNLVCWLIFDGCKLLRLYSKCSKIYNISCLLNRTDPDQTASEEAA